MFNMIPFGKNNSLNKRGDYFDDFFNNFLDNSFFNSMKSLGNGFRVDLKETDSSYILEADLPGISKEDINLTYENNYLTISAKRNNIIEDNNENFIRRERSYGELSRSFYVDNINKDNIKANFKDGVLNITLEKEEKNIPNSHKIYIE